jgi:uncharacterized membrane protein
MKLLKKQLNLNLIPKFIPVLMLLLAFIGFGDALYLTVEHFNNIIPPCTVGGCEIVLSSSYSVILGIPVSLLGSVYYLLMIIFLVLYLDTKKEVFLRIPLLLSLIGFICSAWFVYLMIFVIKAFCPYCAVSAFTSFSIFALSSWLQYLSHYSSRAQE